MRIDEIRKELKEEGEVSVVQGSRVIFTLFRSKSKV
jgi:hypothetical protein